VNSIILADQNGHLGAGLASRGCRLGGIEKLLDVLGERAHWNSYRYLADEFEPNVQTKPGKVQERKRLGLKAGLPDCVLNDSLPNLLPSLAGRIHPP
jgi:hypothetical protein